MVDWNSPAAIGINTTLVIAMILAFIALLVWSCRTPSSSAVSRPSPHSSMFGSLSVGFNRFKSGSIRSKKQPTSKEQSGTASNENSFGETKNGTNFSQKENDLECAAGKKANGDGGGDISVDVSRRTSSHHVLEDEIDTRASSRHASHMPIRQ